MHFRETNSLSIPNASQIPTRSDEGLADPRVILIISPNMGILESWAPILWDLRTKGIKITAVFPKEKTLAQISNSDTITKFGEDFFDSIIIRADGGYWKQAENLTRAKSWGKRYRNALLSRILDRLSRIRGLSTVLGKARRYLQQVDLHQLSKNVHVVCFDVTEEKVEAVKQMQSVFQCAHWFSLPHGIDPRTPREGNVARISRRAAPKTTVYASSRAELPVYESRFGIDKTCVKVVGVPRHDPAWVAHVKNTAECCNIPRHDFVLLISRPHSSLFLPVDRKKQALEDIRKLIMDRLGLMVVVRLHPKETEGWLYDDVFGRGAKGRRWLFSKADPIALSDSSLFCITFMTSVAVDMVAMGVPVIERCDFHNLTEAPQLLRDEEGHVTSSYQKIGLALGARNYDELKRHVYAIMNNRGSIAKQQFKAYQQGYEVIDAPIKIILDDLNKEIYDH